MKNKLSIKSRLEQNKQWHKWIIMALGVLLYLNTLSHQYAQDDTIVIADNMHTKKGFQGIKSLLTKESFHGYFKVEGKENLVSGGRYRPLTLIMFAIEYQVFGASPFVNHLINVLLYGLLGLVIYLLLLSVFRNTIKPDRLAFFSFLVTLIYISHPVHTEAIANIKGRDEIMAMLLGCSSFYMILRENKSILTWIASGVFFFLALMSKENAITLIPLIGIAVWYLQKGTFFAALKSMAMPVLASILFLYIRYSILGWNIGVEPLEMMNNPFVKYANGQYSFFTNSEKYATILGGMGEYIRLLLFPHPLTNDYYPRSIGVLSWNDLSVILSIVTYVFIIGLAIYSFFKQKIVFYGITFFLITISIYSNILFPIGTHLSERFLFMPSLGFAIVTGHLFSFIYYKNIKYVFYIFGVSMLFGFFFKTISRNIVWKNNFTLFTTDVKTSPNSAKALNAAGGILTDTAKDNMNAPERKQMLDQAINYLGKALVIHPNYKNAWLIKGNAHFLLDNYEVAVADYENALKLDPGYVDARGNYALALRMIGRKAGEKENDLVKSKSYLLKSLQYNSQDLETIRLLGIVEGFGLNYKEAVKYFEIYVSKAPNNSSGYVLLSQTYELMGDQEKANAYREQALKIDPNAFKN